MRPLEVLWYLKIRTRPFSTFSIYHLTFRSFFLKYFLRLDLFPKKNAQLVKTTFSANHMHTFYFLLVIFFISSLISSKRVMKWHQKCQHFHSSSMTDTKWHVLLLSKVRKSNLVFPLVKKLVHCSSKSIENVLFFQMTIQNKLLSATRKKDQSSRAWISLPNQSHNIFFLLLLPFV